MGVIVINVKHWLILQLQLQHSESICPFKDFLLFCQVSKFECNIKKKLKKKILNDNCIGYNEK